MSGYFSFDSIPYFKQPQLPSSAVFVLFFIFLLTITEALGQNPLDTKMDFVMMNQTLPEGLWALSEKSEVQIAFSNNDFTKQKYSFTFQQKTIRQILTRLLANSPLTISYTSDQIIVFKKRIRRITISGYVEDQETGERLIGTNIIERHSKKGTSTNEYGFFSLTLQVDKPLLQFSYLGYHQSEIKIDGENNKQLLVVLKPNLTLAEIIVTGKDSLYDKNTNIAQADFSIDQKIENLPSLGGEVDIMRIMQQLPGVQSGTDGFGGLHVRGGNADQNLVLLDGVPIYNPYHTLGLYSIFDYKIINKVRYLRGQFPARFGGRISSVVDVRTKDGNNKSYHSQFTTGLIASKMSVEGPLIKEKGAFFISARRSHLDPVLKKYAKKSRSKDGGKGFYNYYFGEVMGKLNYTFSAKNRVYLSFYKGKDDYHNEKEETDQFENITEVYAENQDLNWGNTLGVLRWNHQFGNKLFSNLTMTFSQFDFNSNEGVNNRSFLDGEELDYFAFQSAYRSQIKNVSAKIDLDYVPNPKHYIRTGMTVSQHLFTPGSVSTRDSSLFDYGDVFPDSLFDAPTSRLFEWTLYLEDEWQLHPKLMINAGVFSSFFVVPDKNYLLIDPRFSLNWQIAKPLQFHFSVNRMSQYLHLLTRSGAGFPSDLWVPSTAKVKPQRSWMLDTGFKYFCVDGWSMATSVYFKKMTNLINYAEGTNFLPNSGAINSNDWEDRVTFGKGESKGLEFLIKKENVKHVGWISYTLSETTRQFSEINNGKAYPFRFDLRHVLNVVYSHQFNIQWSVAGSWNYSSGSHISLALNEWEYIRQDGTPDLTYLNFGKRNSYTLPAYHRLDVSAKYKKKTSWGTWSLDLGVYNVYNRRNIYYIKPDLNLVTKTSGYKSVSLIPALPYFSFNIEL